MNHFRTHQEIKAMIESTRNQNRMPPAASLRVVLGHDWLTGMRGGERVLELAASRYPAAPIMTLLCNHGAISPALNAHPIVTSPLQRLPGVAAYYRRLLPLFPAAEAALRCPPADLVITFSHCVAKGLRPPRGARHLCYCFTPMRYAWLFFDEYVGRNSVKRLVSAPLFAWLRRWDRRGAARVDRFVAISRHVQARIARFYGRDSDVVYPPVHTEFWTPGDTRPAGDYDLIVSALVPYKRLDLAVRLYSRTGRPLVVAGVGGERARLEAAAGPNVRFLGWQPDEALRELYRGCRMLLFPGEEDFGIVPLEAMACGRPVVALARGGVLETVMEGLTGVFFAEQTEAALEEAIARAAAVSWDRAAIRAHACTFGQAQFLAGFDAAVRKVMNVVRN